MILIRPRRRRDDHLRAVAEAQAEQRLFETFLLSPGRQFVAPELHVLLAAQPVGLLGGEQLRHRAIGPGQAARGARVARTVPLRAAGEQSGFPQHHHVANVVMSRANQIDDRIGLRPFAHRFGAGPRLAGAAAGQDQPVDPIAVRRKLIVARPEPPIVQDVIAFGGAQLQKPRLALFVVERKQMANGRRLRVGDIFGRRRLGARTRLWRGLFLRGHLLGCSASYCAAWRIFA
jgi:hypothetical protein